MDTNPVTGLKFMIIFIFWVNIYPLNQMRDDSESENEDLFFKSQNIGLLSE